MEHSLRLGFKASNNEAEYEALLARLKAVLDSGAQDVEVYLDSWLIINQVEGSFEAKDPRMIYYLRLVKQTMSLFQKVRLIQIGQGQNRHADSLATLASSLAETIPWLIKVEVVQEPNIDVKVNVSIVMVFKPCWMDPIIDFLDEDRVLNDEKEAKKVRKIATQYWLFEDRRLYRRSFGRPYLLCLHPSKVDELSTELHKGVCGSHVGGRLLGHRAMSQGFWCPQMEKDAADYVRKCEQCQRHALLIHQPAGSLNPINNPKPFAQWGIDIIGPFPRATGNQIFVLMAMDYLTKSAEAEALANI